MKATDGVSSSLVTFLSCAVLHAIVFFFLLNFLSSFCERILLRSVKEDCVRVTNDRIVLLHLKTSFTRSELSFRLSTLKRIRLKFRETSYIWDYASHFKNDETANKLVITVYFLKICRMQLTLAASFEEPRPVSSRSSSPLFCWLSWSDDSVWKWMWISGMVVEKVAFFGVELVVCSFPSRRGSWLLDRNSHRLLRVLCSETMSKQL